MARPKPERYPAIVKMLVSAPSRAYVAARPYNVYSTGAGRDMFEGRYVTLEAAKEAADKIAASRSPGAYVQTELGLVYTVGKVKL